MKKIWLSLVAILALSGLSLGLSWFRQDVLNSQGDWLGFFKGPDFVGHGFPGWFAKCYAGGRCEFLIENFFLDFLVWMVLWGILFVIGMGLARLIRKKHLG